MEVYIAPDLEEQLKRSAAKQGRDLAELVQEAVARYLANDALYSEALEDWTEDDRLAAMSHIEEGFLQAERGELMDGEQARLEIQAWKDARRQQRQSER